MDIFQNFKNYHHFHGFPGVVETLFCVTYLMESGFSVLTDLSRDLLRDLRPLGDLDLLLDLFLLLDQLRERDLLYFGDLFKIKHSYFWH